MKKRRLKDLNLLDDFLFGSMVTYPKIGEAFSRALLKIIFQREFGKLTVVPQKVYYGSDTDMHGTRLDVYLEEELLEPEGTEKVAIYDVEPNQNDTASDVRALPKRVRFYHAKIDARALKSGDKYQSLKNVIIIMITPYDPFGYGLMVYTIQNGIKELPEAEYEDGAKTLFLYTKGNKGGTPEELYQLLHYMENTTSENAKTETLKAIDEMVRTVKEDEGVTLEYMKIFEREEMLIEMGQRMERENTERERQKADTETARADAEMARADAEAARADASEKRMEELERELREIKKFIEESAGSINVTG